MNIHMLILITNGNVSSPHPAIIVNKVLLSRFFVYVLPVAVSVLQQQSGGAVNTDHTACKVYKAFIIWPFTKETLADS